MMMGLSRYKIHVELAPCEGESILQLEIAVHDLH